MIQLVRLNGKPFFLNEELIELFESTPDTIITLVNGHKYLVKNSVDELVSLIHKEKKA